jgi:HSP20 family protein
MALTRWRPRNAELSPFGSWFDNWPNLSRMMDDFYTTSGQEVMPWGPNVDITENPDSFEIHAELPGVRQDDVRLTLNNNVLTISGEKRQETKENKDNVLRVERNYGRFERSFSLPSTIRADDVRAEFEDGVLHILLPKAEEAKSRQIAIQSRDRELKGGPGGPRPRT